MCDFLNLLMIIRADHTCSPVNYKSVDDKNLNCNLKKQSSKKQARQLFKRLKVGMIEPDDLNEHEIDLLYRYYPFLFER